MNERKYVIIAASEVNKVDFTQVMESSAETLRYSIDGLYTFVKFEGETPSFLEPSTINHQNTHIQKFSIF